MRGDLPPKSDSPTGTTLLFTQLINLIFTFHDICLTLCQDPKGIVFNFKEGDLNACSCSFSPPHFLIFGP